MTYDIFTLTYQIKDYFEYDIFTLTYQIKDYFECVWCGVPLIQLLGFNLKSLF